MDFFEEDIEVLEEYGRKDLADALRKHHLEGTSMPKALKEEIGSYIGGSEYEVSGSEDEEEEQDTQSNTQPKQSVIDLTLPPIYTPITHGTVVDLTKM
jgi:hypothetical protein